MRCCHRQRASLRSFHGSLRVYCERPLQLTVFCKTLKQILNGGAGTHKSHATSKGDQVGNLMSYAHKDAPLILSDVELIPGGLGCINDSVTNAVYDHAVSCPI